MMDASYITAVEAATITGMSAQQVGYAAKMQLIASRFIDGRRVYRLTDAQSIGALRRGEAEIVPKEREASAGGQ